MCERAMYVEAKCFVLESFVADCVKSIGNVTKSYVCSVFVLLSVGYGFMEDDEGTVRPYRHLLNLCWLSLCEILVEAGVDVFVKNFAMDFEKEDRSVIFNKVLE